MKWNMLKKMKTCFKKKLKWNEKVVKKMKRNENVLKKMKMCFKKKWKLKWASKMKMKMSFKNENENEYN